jgi:hypothetical protein
VRDHYARCDALVLECNHDAEMLAGGPYPWPLKRRVGGDLGHLSNAQAAGLVEAAEKSRLQHLVAAHLSEQNNARGACRWKRCWADDESRWPTRIASAGWQSNSVRCNHNGQTWKSAICW